MADQIFQRLALALLLTAIVAQAVFAAFSGLDLTVSGLFADGRAGFPWAESALAAVSLALRRMGEFLAVALVLWVVLGALAGVLRGASLRAWTFAGGSVALASGVIVNLILKDHVGRARPLQIVEFGGAARFTPAWQVTDQCARNCSFTSGEVSLAASLAIAALVLLWPRLASLRLRLLALLGAGLYVTIVSVLRMGLGRHFLSDVVFSLLISAAVALGLYAALRVGEARQTFDLRLPFATAHRLAERGVQRARDWWTRAT